MARALVLAFASVSCVSVPTKDALRDVVNARHAACQHQVAWLAFREEDALGLFRCDADEERYCADYGLEKRCGEWQWP